jgi:predicted Zn-dependent protease
MQNSQIPSLQFDSAQNTPSAKLILQGLQVAKCHPLPQLIGIRKVREVTQYRVVRNERPEDNRLVIDEGLMIEVMVNGQICYAATASFLSSDIQFAFQRAYEMALATANLKVFNFQANQRGHSIGSYRSQRSQELNSMGVSQFNDFLTAATKTMKVSDKIVTTLADIMLIDTYVDYANTAGADFQQDFLMTTSCFSATAQNEVEFQNRSLWGPRGLTRQSGLEVFAQNITNDLLRQTGEEAMELLSAPNCPTAICDVILHPSQMYIQIHESIGHPLEYDRILGDERNFAGWSFIKPTDFGNLQYGSSKLNVTFDPTLVGEFASYSCDDVGQPASREYLIKDGVLVRGLGGLESQARLNLPGVATTRSASWSRAPIDRMANLNVEPGTTPLKDMISSIEKGLFFDSNMSWSIDDYRNKFQFGCEMGRVIENGKLGHVVKNSNYRGSTLQFWRNLEAVGTKDEFEVFGTPFCGKGEPSQVIRVGHASPPCHFKSVDVFGGGK